MTRRPVTQRDEKGEVLILVLIFLLVFGVVTAAVLGRSSSEFALNSATQSNSRLLYASDAGIEWGAQQLQNTEGLCDPNTFDPSGVPATVPLGIPSPTTTPLSDTVKCSQVTSSGSNSFDGYGVISGVGYPAANPQHLGDQTCTGFSADPVSSAQQTFATEVTNGDDQCMAYPGLSAPSWTNDTPAVDGLTQQINAVSSADQTDIWSVGNNGSIDYYNPSVGWTAETDPGVTTTLNGVFATSVTIGANPPTDEVWAVGNSGTILFCSANCTTSSPAPTWVNESAGAQNISAITGIVVGSSVYLWAVGGSTLYSCSGTCSTPGSWTASSPMPGSGLEGVTAVNVGSTYDVWAVGNNAIDTCTSAVTTCSSFSSFTTHAAPGGTGQLTAVDANDPSDMWAVGSTTGGTGTVLTCTAYCTNVGGSAVWVAQTVPSGTQTLRSVNGGDNNDVWAVGNGGTIIFCTDSCNAAAGTWETQTAVTTPPQLNAVVAVPTTSTGSYDGQVWAVGNVSGGAPAWITFTLPSWQTSFDASTQQLNAVNALDTGDAWAVGNNAGGSSNSETIEYFDGEGFTSLSANTPVQDENLYGVYTANATAGTGATTNTNPVWVVGAAGTILYCQAGCAPDVATSSPTWVNESVAGASSYTITAITGVVVGTAVDLWAVGHTNTGASQIFSCAGTAANENCSTGGWTSGGAVTGTPSLTGITAYTIGSTYDVWWVGSNNTIGYCSSTTATPCSSYSNFTSFTKAGWSLNSIDSYVTGTTPDLIAVGGSGVLLSCSVTGTVTCTTAANNWVANTSVPTADTLSSVAIGDQDDAWVVGANGTNAVMYTCALPSTSVPTCLSSTTAWVPGLPTVSAGPLYGITSPQVPTPGGWGGQITAVGGVVQGSATWLTYAQEQAGGSSVLGTIVGGNIFNAQSTNFASPIALVDGNFSQYQTTSCPQLNTPPENLGLVNGNFYCVNPIPGKTGGAALPQAIQNVNEPLPNLAGAPNGNCVPGGASPTCKVQSTTGLHCTPDAASNPCGGPTGMSTCPNGYYEFFPGYYTSVPVFSDNNTYYFESGIYDFDGNQGGDDLYDHADFDWNGDPIGSSPNNSTWIIGGKPSPGDVSTVVGGTSTSPSPCWSAIQATPDQTPAANIGSWFDGGTGAEFILSRNSWMDVHSVHLELFTREPPSGSAGSWEGASGLSIREIPPLCGASPVSNGPSCVTAASGWDPSQPTGITGNPPEIFQVDAWNWKPNVDIHGGIYTPTNDIEEFTNSAAVTLGPIDANSIELSFAARTSPSLTISAGSPNLTPIVELTSVSSGPGTPVVETTLVQTTLDTAGDVLSVKVLKWTVDQANTALPPTIESTTLPGAADNDNYVVALQATGGDYPYTWTATTGSGQTGLPNGLTLSPSGVIETSNNGTADLSGVPVGSYSFTANITDASGVTGTPVPFQIYVEANGPSISGGGALQAVTAGGLYSQTISASGGTQPYSWSIAAGTGFNTLPGGMSIGQNPQNSSQAIIGPSASSGDASGNYSFKVQLTDKYGVIATSVPFSINVGGSPTLTSTSPQSLDVGATNQNVTINGTNFVPGTLLHSAFSCSGITVNSTTYVSATQLTANVSVGGTTTPGTCNVTVTNGDGTTAIGTGIFSVNAGPTLTGANPNIGDDKATDEIVTVSGTNFVPGASLATAFSGSGITVNSTTYNSATQLTANISIATNAATGSRNITVTNGDGTTATATNAFTVQAAPTVTSTSPSPRGQGASNINVTINGTNFINTAALAATFSGTGITVNSVSYLSATQVSANISIASNATTGNRSVTLTNGDGSTATSANGAFSVSLGPTPMSAAPSSRDQGAINQNVVITGSGFASGAVASFSGAGITVNSTTYNSATQVTANITISASAATGAGNITVTNTDGGTETGANVFTVNNGPTITSSSPSINQGASNQNVVVTGTGFINGAVSATFSGTGITVVSTTYNSATQVTVKLSVAAGAATGTRTITLTNGDGSTAVGTNVFTVSTPTITSASPSVNQGASNQSVVVTGTNFVNGTLSSTVSGSGVTVVSTTYNSATQVTVKLSVAAGAATGTRTITLTNGDGSTAVGTNVFTVSTPTITAATSLDRGATNQSVVVTGTNFVNGTLSSTVSGTGITDISTTYNSATQVTIQMTVTAGAATGTRTITLTNGDGTTATGNNVFTVNGAPTITSLSPGTVTHNTTATVTITGTNFDNAPGMFAVGISGNGITINSTTWSNSTTASVNITVANSATRNARTLTLTNGDGTTATSTLTIN